MSEEEKPKPAAKPAAKPKEASEPPPPSPDESPIYKRFKQILPDALAEGSQLDRGDLILRIKRERVLDACRALRDDPELRFDYLSSVTAVDYPERERRFDVVWTMTSIPHKRRFNLVAEVAEGEPVASVCELYRTADWFERETWDMFGVVFEGHPNLKRILLPDWWEGFPLRKDYPTEGRGEHELVVEECLRPRE